MVAISSSCLYKHEFIGLNPHLCLFQARQLVGSTLLVREDDRPELDEGEFYTRDLVGMRVILKVIISCKLF